MKLPHNLYPFLPEWWTNGLVLAGKFILNLCPSTWFKAPPNITVFGEFLKLFLSATPLGSFEFSSQKFVDQLHDVLVTYLMKTQFEAVLN